MGWTRGWGRGTERRRGKRRQRRDRKKTKKDKLKPHFSSEAVAIIRGFLAAKPTKRLGIIKGGMTKIQEYNWFKDFDWQALFAGTMPAPKIESKEDRSNFEVYDDGAPEDDEYIDDGTGWDKDF